MHSITEAQTPRKFFTIRFVASVPQNDAFKGDSQQGQRFQEDIHSLASNNLTSVNDEVSITECAAKASIDGRGNGRINSNFFWIDSISNEFLLHELGHHDHAIEPLVQGNLSFFLRETC